MTGRMEWLFPVAYVVKIAGAVMAASWAAIVLYDVTVAEASRSKVLLHILYVMLSLAFVAVAVIFPPKIESSASDARQTGAAAQSN